jgi:hypothetical protein
MVGVRRISGAGRGLLVLGAALLLVNFFGSILLTMLPSLPWFTISGNRPELPVGSYDAIQSTQLLNRIFNGSFAWFAFGWLLVVTVAGFAIAGIGERIRHFGTSGILVLLLVYGGTLFLAAYQYNQQAPGGNAAISIGYGFVLAVVACALIEAGARWPSPVPMRARIPISVQR